MGDRNSNVGDDKSLVDDSHHWTVVIIICAATSAFIVLVIVAFFIIRFMHRRRQKITELEEMTPNGNTYSTNTIGVLYKQPIKFTLPAITVDNSEPGISNESDFDKDIYSSSNTGNSSSQGTSRGIPRNVSHQKISSMERYQISADEIEPELYVSESDDGLCSRISGLGKVGFSLQYNLIRQQLCVKIIGATNLPTKFLQKGTANPFVKLLLYPEKSPKYLTKVQRNTTNPIFQEMFVFQAKIDDINCRILRISVWDYDKFSRKVPIGGISVPLNEMGITSSIKEDVITDDVWRELTTKETEKQCKGELLFSLSYKPDTSTLTVVIIKTKNLKWLDVKGDKEHVYVKIRLMEGKKLMKSKKTQAVRKKDISEFDYVLSQYVPHSLLNDITVDLLVFIKSGFSGKQLVGRTQVGNNSDIMDQGVHHWTDMLDAPRSTVAQWHSIY